MRLTVEDRAACVAELVLKDWLCGKKNTLQTEEQNINQVRKSEQSESHKGVHLMPTASTCTTTTNPIKENSICTEKLTSPNAMTDDANATQPMKNTESKNVQMPESKMQLTLQENDMVGSNLPMESELKNTNNSLLNKRENVQFAETLKPTKTNMELSDSLSITAIQAEKSEGYSVPLATLESGSSRMTLKDFVKQLRTSKSSLIKTFQNNLDSWVIWCNTNYEQDELDKLFGDTAFSVRGSQSLTEKEHCIIGWLNSERPVLISKPSICGFGMNFQHCHNTAFVGLSYSFEQFYQAIRRLYRFGQKEEVQCHIIAAETEGAMVATLERKIQAHMQMSEQMNASVAKLGLQENLNLTQYNPQIPMIVPEWLHSENERKST